ncbi:MAG TPA: MBL fold metallo-hydrolase [Pseudobdellovibrionaceae bacterium]|nr:MBL fold metallo-hydrolase [Pseudobdellovibrionaceae bacterium]
MKLKIKPFFDHPTYTLTYVVYHEDSRDAVVIDPVLDYDPSSSKVSQKSFDEVCQFVDSHKLNLLYVLETHAHADHLSSSQYFKAKYPNIKIAIGENIKKVQEVFKDIFNLGSGFKTDGSQFDILLKDNEVLNAGTLKFKVINTPGHTPACVSYLIEDALFAGDTLFMPDYGTGRCDFPAGDASIMYQSITKLYNLPDSTRVFVGHDYQPGGRGVEFETSIGEQKNKNIQLNSKVTKEEYVSFREKKDKTLAAPRLLLPSVQVNIHAGQFPSPDSNGVKYLKIPIR